MSDMRSGVGLLAATGCAVAVDERVIGPNQYIVEAEGKNRHSHAEVLEAAHNRAAELCGVGRYRLLDNANSQRNGAYFDAYGNVHGTRSLTVVLT